MADEIKKSCIHPLQCPKALVSPLIRIVIDEMRKTCKKQPIACGFIPLDNAYEPLKLMQSVILKVNEVCQRYLDNSVLCSLPSPGPPNNLVSCCAVKNSRRRMEDRHIVVHDLNGIFIDQEATPSSYYAIFDGHAGHDAAAYSAAHLHQFLAESKHFAGNPEQALKDAFHKTDELFIQKCKVENFSSGTTAVCALLRPKEKTLYVAWVGDSQALLANQGKILQCVNPHKPGRQDEKDRVENLGGVVIHWGTWRVNGQLAVSRAIGDSEYKPYVTATPDVREIPLTGTEDFLILACDGLWDFLSEEDAAILVYKMVYENPDDTESISQRLVQLAKEQHSTDNISVIVVFFREPSKIAAEAHWASRNVTAMDAGLDNANATNNPFTNSNGSDILGQKDPLLHYLRDGYKPNGAGEELFRERTTFGGKRPGSDVFDVDDLGPETDVDAADEALLSPAKVIVEHGGNNNPFDAFHNTELEEKVAMEIDMNLQKHEADLMEGEKTPREETPTPPAEEVHDAGLVDNVADSGEDSEDEWNYYKGDTADKENVPPSRSDREVADIISGETENKIALEGEGEEDNSMSQLNPDAAEFVPISPTRVAESPICAALIKEDTVLAQSPKRAPAVAQDVDINLPNPQDFEKEVKSRPSEVFSNGHENGHKSTIELMEDLLNGKNIDEIEFQPNSTPKKPAQEEFHFGPNATPFSTPGKLLDQSEAFSTKANFGDESTVSLLEEKGFENSFGDSTDFQPFNKEQDPMSMSFYQEKEDTADPFDLNRVQTLPENVDDFIESSFNETISDLPEHEVVQAVTDLDKHDDLLGVCELPKSPQPPTPEPTLDENLCAKSPEPVIETKEIIEASEELCNVKTPEPDSCLMESPGDVCMSPIMNFCGTETPEQMTACPESVESHVCTESPETVVCAKSPSEPAIPTPEPLVCTESPEPIIPTPEPLVCTKSPDPIILTPEPIIPTPEPTIPTPEPTIPTPEPTIPTPEPTIPTPEPKIPTPEPTISTPEPEFTAKSPEPVFTAKSPEPEFTAKSPEPEFTAKSPEPEPEILAKSSEVCVKSPEPPQLLCAMSPELEPSDLSPEPELPIESPQPDVCAESPTPEVCVASPEIVPKSPEPLVEPEIISPEPELEVCERVMDDLASPEPSTEEICVKSPEEAPVMLECSPPEQQIRLTCSLPLDACPPFRPAEIEQQLESPHEDITSSVKDDELLTPIDVETNIQMEDQKDIPVIGVNSALMTCVFPLPPEVHEMVSETKAEPPTPEQDEQPKVIEDVIVSAAAVAAVAAATAAVTSKLDEKKPATKPKATIGVAKKPAPKTATSPIKASAAKPPAIKLSASRTTTAAKPAPAKTPVSPKPPPISRMSATKPKVPLLTTKTSTEKKPLPNGDAPKTAAAPRKPSVPSMVARSAAAAATKAASAAKPADKAAATTKPASSITSKPSSTATRTVPVSTAKPRPNTLATKTTTATKTLSSAVNKTSLTKIASSPKSTTAAPIARPKPASAPVALKPRVPLTSRTVAKAPDAEKQNKENVNKLTASRTSTTASKTTLGSVTNRTTTVRKTESKAKPTTASTTLSKSNSVPKRPSGELAKNGPVTKAATKTTSVTKVSKPKENGIPNGVTTVTEITTVKVTSNDVDELMVKDHSPVEENNLIIDNSQIPLTTVAD